MPIEESNNLATTTLSNVIAYNGFTWTFSQAHNCGFFFNGDPFVVSDASGGVTLIKVEPAPEFVPTSQIFTSDGSVYQPVMTDSNVVVGGVTAGLWGIVSNGTTTGVYINCCVVNPQYGDSYNILNPTAAVGGFIPCSPQYIDTSNPRSYSQTQHSSFKVYLGGNIAADLAAYQRMVNIPNQHLRLVSGDMLSTYKTNFYKQTDRQAFGRIQNLSGSGRTDSPPPYEITPSPVSNFTDRIYQPKCLSRQTMLSVVSETPEENQFRPPAFWSSTTNRPKFIYDPVTAPDISQILTVPSLDIGGANITPDVNSKDLFPLDGNTMADKMNCSYITTFYSLTPIYRSDVLTFPLEQAMGVTTAMLDSNFASVGAFRFPSPTAIKNRDGFWGLRACCPWVPDADRDACKKVFIQAGIDHYGKISLNTPTVQTSDPGHPQPDVITPIRAHIILAGYMMGVQGTCMMNVDSLNTSLVQGIFNTGASGPYPTSGGITWDENYKTPHHQLNFSNINKLNSVIRFAESAGSVRITGKWGDPTKANNKATLYTDPDTTDHLGIGWMLKYVGADGSGMTAIKSGSTFNNAFASDSSIVTSSPYSTSDGITRGWVMFALHQSTPFPFPRNNIITAAPKVPQTEPPGINSNNLPSTFKNLKVRIKSGAGAGLTTYRIIGRPNLAATEGVGNGFDFAFSTLTSSWSEVAAPKVLFYLDKPWANGDPDSNSKFIIYPFDDTDIGTVAVCSRGPSVWNVTFPDKNDRLGYNSMACVGPISHNMNTLISEFGHPMSYYLLYGLIYRLGIYETNRNIEGGRNVISPLLTNEITQEILDGIILQCFDSNPFGNNSKFNASTVDPAATNYKLLDIPVINLGSAPAPNQFLGGIMRQLWQREARKTI